jgi:hypothetical protein
VTLAHSGRALSYTWQPDAAAVQTHKRYHMEGLVALPGIEPGFED